MLLIPVGLCFGIVDNFISYNRPPPEFCTKEDEVYQLIVAHADDWVTYFHDSHPEFSVVNFSTSDGTGYVAIPNWYGANLQFYVQIRRIRDEPYGLSGYAFNGISFLDHRYMIRQLDHHIYCYEL
jgi:hypothetical protein